MPRGPKGERGPRDVIGNAVHVMPTMALFDGILRRVGTVRCAVWKFQLPRRAWKFPCPPGDSWTHRKSVRPFKGRFCNNISEFESDMPSHAVASLWPTSVRPTLVVDIETERLGGGVEIGAVNEQGHFFRFGFHPCSRVRSSKTSIPTPDCARLPSRPAAPGHCHVVEDEAACASRRYAAPAVT